MSASGMSNSWARSRQRQPPPRGDGPRNTLPASTAGNQRAGDGVNATHQAVPMTRASWRQLLIDPQSGNLDSSFTRAANNPRGSVVVAPMPTPDEINQMFATDFRASLVTPTPSDLVGINSMFQKTKACQPLPTPSSLPGAMSRPRDACDAGVVPDGSAELPVIVDDDVSDGTMFNVDDEDMLDADMLDAQDSLSLPTAPAIGVHGTRHRETVAAGTGSKKNHSFKIPNLELTASHSSRPIGHRRPDQGQHTGSAFQRGEHRQQLSDTYQSYHPSIGDGKDVPGANNSKRNPVNRAPAFSSGQASSHGEKQEGFHRPATAPMAPPSRSTHSLPGRGGLPKRNPVDRAPAFSRGQASSHGEKREGFQRPVNAPMAPPSHGIPSLPGRGGSARPSTPSTAEHIRFDNLKQGFVMSLVHEFKNATYKAMVVNGNLDGSQDKWDSLLDASFTEAANLLCENAWVPDLWRVGRM